MRCFWLFILSLIVLTGALFALRLRNERAASAALQERLEAQQAAQPGRSARRPRRERPPAQPQPAPAREEKPEPQPEPEPEPVPTPEPLPEPIPEPVPEPIPDPKPEPEPQVDQYGLTPPVGDIIIEGLPRPAEDEPTPDAGPTVATTEPAQPSGPQNTTQPEPQTEPQPEPAAQPAPTFERLGDGSFRVLATDTLVIGEGSADSPYRLSWKLLKSVENGYDPKSGDESLPDWLDLLDGKAVTIEGHSLVPVIADTTRELLIMQNPWDGCCIGVPPSPYDAIEATLEHDVDFGSSAVGYGTITGTFYLDPYVVDGWVLGLYIIEDGAYRSGEGVSFPEF